VFPGFNLADGMSKAAVAFMTKQLAAEHVHTPLDVFAICPGATDTPMFQASTLNKLSDSGRSDFITALPKSQLIKPKEIAEVVLFLMSEKSRVLHGAVIDASMGLGSRPGLMTELKT
jgi:NAD(P)-dependent dehydrogenase (short-subunit alcohol dehydrogenase family)